MAGAAAFFWAARALFRRGGVRRTVRMVSALGFAVSLLAIAQAATAGRDIYWRFRTEFEGPLPFGPFVNRNHFATWVDHGAAAVPGIHCGPLGAAADEPEHATHAHAARARHRSADGVADGGRR